jgi:hypothetical protein
MYLHTGISADPQEPTKLCGNFAQGFPTVLQSIITVPACEASTFCILIVKLYAQSCAFSTNSSSHITQVIEEKQFCMMSRS